MSTNHRVPDHLQRPLPEHGRWFLRRVWDRINRKNNHFMMCIVGEEGSGKSYTSMKIAHEVDPTFNVDRVLFDVSELLRILRDREHEPGNFYVLDEAGVQLGRRTWQDREQVLVNQCLQLIRNHNLGLIFTLPRLGELDSQAQGRLQAFLELTDKELDEYVEGKLKILDPDRTDETGVIYKKYPRRRINGVVKRIVSMSYSPPPSELTAPYEKKKREFQEQVYDKTLQKIEDEVEEEQEQERSARDVVEMIKDNDAFVNYVKEHPSNGQKYIDEELIAYDYDISKNKAKTVKKVLGRDRLERDNG